MARSVKVLFSEEANKQYEELNRVVGDEIKKGVTNSFHQQLLKSINQKKELLKINPQAGIHIAKSLVPKLYKDKYDVNNLWKIDLSGYWRMIYTLRTTEIEITNFVLDFLDHETYDKVFGYKKK
ncbi:MAG: hypothetical protein HYU56_01645 [Candidatus Aenigmarchaeota archaeon]|nr:hypothetical protein [Candidatus Aenigmarchaeota archaeon]